MRPVPAPTVRVLSSAADAIPLLLGEVHAAVARRPQALLGFATGSTFTLFLQALAAEFGAGRLRTDQFVATHLDEYLDFPPDRRGSMVHELCEACPPLAQMLQRGTFLPVPCSCDERAIQAHEQRLVRAGGVVLQLLGIGRNGHIAFNEPGTPFERGCHRTELAATTRNDARARFAPDEPPTWAVTSGPATILAAERIVLCAFGKAKAEAVRAMLRGPVATSCPASVLRRHANVLVLLDPAAAAEWSADGGASA
jgi:glucosamine-6-phosphate deaminase